MEGVVLVVSHAVMVVGLCVVQLVVLAVVAAAVGWVARALGCVCLRGCVVCVVSGLGRWLCAALRKGWGVHRSRHWWWC